MKAPGVRWRGRKPPEPPKYDNPRDLRSFPGWERKIQLWKKKTGNDVAPAEKKRLPFTCWSP